MRKKAGEQVREGEGAGGGGGERENFGYNKIQISARTNSPYRGI